MPHSRWRSQVPRFAQIPIATKWVHRMKAQIWGDELWGWPTKTSNLLKLDEKGGAWHRGSEESANDCLGIVGAQGPAPSTAALEACSGVPASVLDLTCSQLLVLLGLTKVMKRRLWWLICFVLASLLIPNSLFFTNGQTWKHCKSF